LFDKPILVIRARTLYFVKCITSGLIQRLTEVLASIQLVLLGHSQSPFLYQKSTTTVLLVSKYTMVHILYIKYKNIKINLKKKKLITLFNMLYLKSLLLVKIIIIYYYNINKIQIK